MRTIRATLTSATALFALFGTAVPPAFADMCFNAAGVIIVAQAYVKPGPGKCRPLLGNAGHNAISGTVCATTDGTFLRVGYTLHPGLGAPVEMGQMDLPLPSMTGGTLNYRQIHSDGTITVGTGLPSHADVCSPPAQPIP